MHRNVLLLTTIGLYYVLATVGLYMFDAGLLVSSVVLFGFPSLALAHFTLAPPAVLLSVAFLGAGVAVLFEGVAHIYGLWYSMGITEARFFGLVPIEMFAALLLQTIFLGLLYEVLFDDGVYTPRSAWQRMTFFGVFFVSVLVLIGLHQYVLNALFLSYSYLWIIGILLASAFSALLLHKSTSILFFDKVIDFTLIASVPLGISLWIASANVHKVFAHTNEYLGELLFFGHSVPVEEIVLLFALPLFVATIYEIYLDDEA